MGLYWPLWFAVWGTGAFLQVLATFAFRRSGAVLKESAKAMANAEAAHDACDFDVAQFWLDEVNHLHAEYDNRRAQWLVLHRPAMALAILGAVMAFAHIAWMLA